MLNVLCQALVLNVMLSAAVCNGPMHESGWVAPAQLLFMYSAKSLIAQEERLATSP